MQFDALITDPQLVPLGHASRVRYSGSKYGVGVHERIFKAFKGVTYRKLSVLHGIMSIWNVGYPQELVGSHFGHVDMVVSPRRRFRYITR